MSKHIHSYLALGDSYTIGESVPLHDSFPYQVVQLLRKQGISFHAPEIVAKTGWTSSELAEHLLHHNYEEQYDFVTLLIGVNNQYRRWSMDDYKNDFEFLLKKAIHLAQDKKHHVVVLSIPDWGVTPFAKGRDAAQIAKEIDAFNTINHDIAQAAGVHYVEITKGSRHAKEDNSLLAADGLHYSGKEHAKWAEQVAFIFQKMIQAGK
ncbi:MAG TPA: lysophospholipase [Chitinophagaceae bacterium]|nr:lysophospholipase [Chitinophagaceae bacterium]